jgi:hypothetical protein
VSTTVITVVLLQSVHLWSGEQNCDMQGEPEGVSDVTQENGERTALSSTDSRVGFMLL